MGGNPSEREENVTYDSTTSHTLNPIAPLFFFLGLFGLGLALFLFLPTLVLLEDASKDTRRKKVNHPSLRRSWSSGMAVGQRQRHRSFRANTIKPKRNGRKKEKSGGGGAGSRHLVGSGVFGLTLSLFLLFFCCCP
ncbi:hypothetical protein B0T24DRAFT_639705 [Lasiosphaeria ovina]|uniref:Transmembrane protein n=1 Tax=Lasiosphaeria ovina TaxID=92902 RepID=A0AAE0JVV2_9PEZI|nr:hypothetical protein B0T24DRAFT_639705 [Lasiosphaeria ovina]